ncbi:hypothetical protein EPICR_30327 [Candidatus Desulfarcum epimagneticum]|uniref:Uncharacterized protein n=1 Tax=uncultured Desulfobacteraceae bacterium TaxID=218296 RepID=A0A484HGQ5_9BACT|nr:hypothetical protein EPICR_30327 [uncultured Desulfobacteraceae bacterium]
MAADGSADAGEQLKKLEHNATLKSYHDLIRHERVQYENRRRESEFIFASPCEIAEALQDGPPATPNDLLAFVYDHLNILGRKLARTQTGRYQAYWNQDGHDLIQPKDEPICSGLLAEDLQNRINSQGLIVTVEHHMVSAKKCDLVVLQGTDRLLPIEVKHHFNSGLWTAWRDQLDKLYTRDAKAGGLGIYLVLWSGEAKKRMPKLPNRIERPANAIELNKALESLIPQKDRRRLRVVVVDISPPDSLQTG